MTTDHALPYLSENPSWLLTRARHRAHQIVTDRLDAIGARRYHLRVLSVLVEHGPLPQVAIGQLADLDRADLSVTVDELEAEATVVREPDPGDGRRKIVRITPDGQARVAQIGAAARAAQEELLAPLDPEEREPFIAALRKLQP
ncbi:MarR family winged helix-turn-helix transcriptional regulator [Microbacterium karelineae]|uniref:MarR family winged helix-turn-helix transcriptional regulator n=1 Tax=Microbacterium karelineae TaxID=2654283 RepID=UPI0012EAEAD0|nr:MarR family transcriptional regulator [Microbacterium karelineae]